MQSAPEHAVQDQAEKMRELVREAEHLPAVEAAELPQPRRHAWYDDEPPEQLGCMSELYLG